MVAWQNKIPIVVKYKKCDCFVKFTRPFSIIRITSTFVSLISASLVDEFNPLFAFFTLKYEILSLTDNHQLINFLQHERTRE